MGNEQRVALIVGAGGPTGGPFIDAALQEISAATGWPPASADLVVGTSAGAFVAARIGPKQPPADEVTLARLRRLSNGFRWEASSRDLILANARLKVARVLAAVAPTGRPVAEYKVAPRPYHQGSVAVTVRHRGTRVAHRLANADDPVAVVRASAAIPFVNGPVRVGADLHVDGAVHSPTNSDLALAQDYGIILVVAPMIPSEGGSVSDRLHRSQLRSELDGATRLGRSVIVIAPTKEEHSRRKDREFFGPAGATAVRRILRELNP